MTRPSIGQRISPHGGPSWRERQRQITDRQHKRICTLLAILNRPNRRVTATAGAFEIVPEGTRITRDEIETLTRRGVLLEQDAGLFPGFPQSWITNHNTRGTLP